MTTRYARHPAMRLTALEGEGVVLHLGARKYFSVNETGLAMLEAMNEPRTIDALVATLMDGYDVGSDEAASTVNGFITQCLASDLLVVEREA
jgi:hypothetical protein